MAPDPVPGSAAPPFDVLPFFTASSRARSLRLALGELEGQGLSAPYRPAEGAELAVAWGLRRGSEGSGDLLIPARDSFAAPLAFGATPAEVFRQALGRRGSPSRGQESGFRWTDFERGLLAPISPEGTMLEVAAGVGMALRMKGEERVVAILTGEGSSAGGAWHEGLNLAAVQRIPLLLAVFRNASDRRTGGGTRHSRLDSFLDKCAGYGIEGVAAESHDLFALAGVATEAVERARTEPGVQLLEVWVASTDPFEDLRGMIVTRGWADEQALREIEDAAAAESADARTEAQQEPPLTPDAAYSGAWSGIGPGLAWEPPGRMRASTGSTSTPTSAKEPS